MFKRLLTTLVGMPLLFVVLIFGNKYIVDVIVTVLALVSIHEYMKCYYRGNCIQKFIFHADPLRTLLISLQP